MWIPLLFCICTVFSPAAEGIALEYDAADIFLDVTSSPEEYYAPMSESAFQKYQEDEIGNPCRPSNAKDKGIDYKADETIQAVRGGERCCKNGLIFTGFKLFRCKNIDLASLIPLSEFFSVAANDIWGWTDENGVEFALVGLKDGTGFVNLKDPSNPVLLGKLPSHNGFVANWRDIKVFQNHAFIVSESIGHGMQVFDLTQLSSLTSGFTFFQTTAHYSGCGHSHNIAINEDSGFAYIVGSNRCSSGLLIVDINEPTSPTEVGCYSEKGYTHDVQCVIYNGTDTDHVGKEICFAFNEDRVDIIDVTDKTNIQAISEFRYPFTAYTHQGWLTEDHQFLVVNDEIDEIALLTLRTRSIIADVTDLDNPFMIDAYKANSKSIDHNLYIKDNYIYEANYRSGLRVLDSSRVASGDLEEVAFFDFNPLEDLAMFNGAWSSYIWFDSGIVIVSVIEQGLYVLRPQTDSFRTLAPTQAPLTERCEENESFFRLDLKNGFGHDVSWTVQRANGESLLTSSTSDHELKTEEELQKMQEFGTCLAPGCYAFNILDSTRATGSMLEGVVFFRGFLSEEMIFRGNTLTCSDSHSFCISDDGRRTEERTSSFSASKLSEILFSYFKK